MKFKAKYMHRRDRKANPDKYRDLFADTLEDAIKLAERWTTKGYIMAGVTHTESFKPQQPDLRRIGRIELEEILISREELHK